MTVDHLDYIQNTSMLDEFVTSSQGGERYELHASITPGHDSGNILKRRVGMFCFQNAAEKYSARQEWK